MGLDILFFSSANMEEEIECFKGWEYIPLWEWLTRAALPDQFVVAEENICLEKSILLN